MDCTIQVEKTKALVCDWFSNIQNAGFFTVKWFILEDPIDFNIDCYSTLHFKEIRACDNLK